MFEDAYAEQDELLVEGALVDQKYMIVRQLSQGGQGYVYLAEHLTLSGLFVAIKVLSGKINGEALERFKREAMVMAKFSHPNIVRILDFGELEGGYPFMVMEFLNGEPLKKRIEKGPIPLELTTAILEQICSALQAAHHHKIIHRDLKPDNIFLCMDENQPTQTIPQVKLLDFGVTKVLGVDTITPRKQGNFLGTPQYMSPEQAKGALEIDQRADLFSLCTILFEMLSTHLPFGGNQLIEIVSAIVLGDPRSLKALVPTLPDQVEKVIFKGLSKNPADRYPDAQSLFQAFKTASTPSLQNSMLAYQLQQIQTPSPIASQAKQNPFQKPMSQNQGFDQVFKINQTPSPFYQPVTLTPPQNLEDYPKTSITMIPNFVDEEDATLANDQPLSDTESSMPTVYMREPSYYASPTPKKQFNPIFIAMIVGICFVLALIFFSHDSNDQEVQSQDNTQTQSTQNDQNLVKKAPEVIAFLTTKVVKENAVSSTNMKYFDINSPCYTVLDLFSKEPGVVEIRWYRQDHKLRKPIERFEYPGNKALSSTKIVKFTFQENEAGRWYAEVIYQNQILKKIHFDVSK